MSAEVEVKGLRELRAALVKIIPAEMQGKVLQKALAAGTRVTVKQAKANVPVKTGRLKKAIYAIRDKESKPTFESRVISVKRGKKAQKSNRDAFYWKFVEFGHRTGARKGEYLRKTTRTSGGVESKGVVDARPFMRPAFDSTKSRALEAITVEMRKQLDKAAAKAKF